MPESPELYGIVILGSMNPSIHHPAWYQAVKILSPEEAGVSKLATCGPMVSQFEASGLTVQCLQDRWEIQSRDPGKLKQMLDFAGRTFEILTHTPVSGFGLNFHFVRPTGVPNVAKRLAEMVSTLPLWREAVLRDSAMFATQTTTPDRHAQETVLGMAGAVSCVQVIFNIQYMIQRKPTYELFELGPLLRDAFERDYPESLDRAEKIAKALASDKME